LIAVRTNESERQRCLKLQRERAALYRRRRSLGAVCVTVELLQSEIDRLVALGLLENGERTSRVAISEALHVHFERTLGGEQ
jgi:hypothetical protein